MMAFHELRSDRQIGMSVGPIPWSSIDRWAVRHNITNLEDFDELVSYIRQMEAALIEYEEKQGKDTK